MPKLLLYKKGEGRYITDNYIKNDEKLFSIFERTDKGVLVSEFSYNEGVISQKYIKGGTIPELLLSNFGDNYEIIEKKEMKKTSINKTCRSCGGVLYRELEFVEPWNIVEIPVLPIFKCESCGQRSYSLTKRYLECLVDEHMDFFDESEMAEMKQDREKFIKTLNENIIRIFASKRINRI